jgi:anti-sigma factor RsiW
MNHQPFSSWLYEDSELNTSQVAELRRHLLDCPECTQQREAWMNVRQMMHTIEPVQPHPGFSKRWQASLEARRARQQRRQVRITILSLSGAALLILLGLIAYFFSTSSLADLFASMIGTSTQVAVGLLNIGEFFQSLLRFLPPALSTAIWFILASWICLLCFVWVFSVWRISTKGVVTHEEHD